MDIKGRILSKDKEPKPDITVCAASTVMLRARIEVWFRKPKQRK